jgi:ferrous iron transport protein B
MDISLKEIKTGESATVTVVGGEGALRQHFLDMGIIPGTKITVVKYAPLGDPVEIMIRGYELTLRLDDAAKIGVERIPADTEIPRQEMPKQSQKSGHTAGHTSAAKAGKPAKTEHPGLGEGGRYHDRSHENPLPDGTTLTFALVGNQNSGKTTLFNQLTGSNQHVGNFPGVTVDRKDGVIKGHPDTLITDLPGIYSMSPYSSEELVSRDFVMNEKPCAIINIVDATNIERNLYLTMQLLEMGIPMVVALNMMDEVTANGGTVDINKMEAALGVPVVPISAAKNHGINELIEHAVHVAHYREAPVEQDYCSEEDHNGAVHRCLHAVEHLTEDHAKRAGIPLRFATGKLIEGDRQITEKLKLDPNELETVEHIVLQMEKERGLDRSASIADMRYCFIEKICRASVHKPHKSQESIRSEKIDRILTGRFTAIPIFILIMALVFWLTFDVIGGGLQQLLETGIDSLTDLVGKALNTANVNEVLKGLILDGIFAGVGSVLSFLPIIVTLFFFLSLLEDSGYIARVAFFMDKLLRKLGLSGRSIVPMLIGFGCTVPAVMSTRTLPSERDRRMTILLTPFMSCTAKLPIYMFFVDAFFPKYKALITCGLYLLGILVGILAAILFKHTIFKGEAVPFVMELPNYRLPGPVNVIRLLWEKAKDFLQRAFTIIFIATIVIWLLQSFSPTLSLVEDQSRSILAYIAGFLAPVMVPAGLGDWRICTSLISGFIAKESVVSTLEILFGQSVASVMLPATAVSLLVFSLLYTPCIAAVAAVKRELGRKWALALVIWQCAIAWVAAVITNLITMLF